MRPPHAARAAPARAVRDPKIEQLPGSFNSHNTKSDSAVQLLPSKSVLARKWPRLKINRLTWRWIDDASGTKGNDLGSLVTFLNERGAR